MQLRRSVLSRYVGVLRNMCVDSISGCERCKAPSKRNKVCALRSGRIRLSISSADFNTKKSLGCSPARRSVLPKMPLPRSMHFTTPHIHQNPVPRPHQRQPWSVENVLSEMIGCWMQRAWNIRQSIQAKSHGEWTLGWGRFWGKGDTAAATIVMLGPPPAQFWPLSRPSDRQQPATESIRCRPFPRALKFTMPIRADAMALAKSNILQAPPSSKGTLVCFHRRRCQDYIWWNTIVRRFWALKAPLP